MKFLAIIPARYASTRFPGKPLAMISGKTMIERVYEQSSKAFENVYVATDNSQIFKTVEEFGGRAIMTLSSHLNGTSRVLEAMTQIEKLRGVHCKYVINIQGDEPFIKPEQLKELIECFNNPQTEIATLVKEITDSSELFSKDIPKVVLGTNGQALYFSRSPIPHIRDIPSKEWLSNHQYYKHIGLYGYKRETLLEIAELAPSPLEKAESLEQLRWLESGIKIATNRTLFDSYSIDTPQDIENLRAKEII
ncbi:MAG: 3-deoxy-manno-octulosonate cytidylyltransferase [Bacteroidales bacterium]|nr:3-deoxy-manno-octulosonate cytidylyltransferase [Bacteroidales bacterium]